MSAAMDRAGWRPGSALYGEVLEFLYREADLLDNNRYSGGRGHGDHRTRPAAPNRRFAP